MNSILEKILEVEVDQNVYEHLLQHQIAHVQNLIYAIEQNGVGLDCSDTGSGKSYSAAAICAARGLRPLFIGPKAGITNLYTVCDIFGVEPLGNVNYETFKNGKYYTSLENFHNEERVKCPYIEIIREQAKDGRTRKPIFTPTGKPKMIITNIIWKLPLNTLIVFDEAHKGRNGKSSGQNTCNSKLMISMRSYLNKANKIYGLFLSATLTDKLDNFDVIAYILGLYRPYQSKIYKQFLRKFGKTSSDIYVNLHKLLFPRYASRMSIKTIKRESGDSIFRNNDVMAAMYPVNKETALQIEETHQQIKQALEEIRSKGITKGWGAIMRYWQRIEVLKVPTVADTIIKHLQEGKAVVVFINFIETKNLIIEYVLNHSANIDQSIINMSKIDVIDGGQKSEERDSVVQQFQDNETDLLVCSIKAGGIAISLHDLNDKQRISIVFPTWSATDLKQALGRIYRANAKSDAIQRIVYCTYSGKSEIEKMVATPGLPGGPPIEESKGEGEATLSIEEMLCRNVNIKLENIELLNTGNLLDLQKIEVPDEISMD